MPTMPLELEWPLALADIELALDSVHIWSAPLVQPAEQIAAFWDSLTVIEQERADRFHFDLHRQHYIVARGLLRLLLGRYLGTKPHDIHFEYSAYDKPFLPGNPLFFNISHSGDVGLFAFCLETAVGIDIEKVKPLDDLNAVAVRFFAAGEYATLQSLPIEKQADAFFRCWARKEAFIKLIGEGLSYPLDNFEVTLTADEPARLLSIGGSESDAAAYQLEHLEPAASYMGALALPTKKTELFCWQWTN